MNGFLLLVRDGPCLEFLFGSSELGLHLVDLLLDDYCADEVLLLLLLVSVAAVDELLHAVVAAEVLDLLGPDLLLLAREGGEQAEEVLAAAVLVELALVLLVVDGQRLDVAALGVVVIHSSNIIRAEDYTGIGKPPKARVSESQENGPMW